MNWRVVILAHAEDGGAAAVAKTVARRLGPCVDVLRPEVLGLCRWSHRVDAAGRASTRLTPPGTDATLDTEATGCVFNRLRYLSSPRFARASAKDRDYAAAELQAVVASWLGGLGERVVNPTGARGLVCPFFSGRGWVTAAAACGLPVSRTVAATAGRLLGPLRSGERVRGHERWPGGLAGPMPVMVAADDTALSPAGRVLVTGAEAHGSLTSVFGPQCVALARRVGHPLLEFRFSRLADGPVLTAVDPLPPLDDAGAVDAVSRLVETVVWRGVAPA